MATSNNKTFGALHGDTIGNKHTILSTIDKKFKTEAPDLEFIFAESVIKSNSGVLQTIKTSLGRFGHSACRYKYYPDINKDKYEDIVFNIVGTGVKNARMVNFIPTEEYLFGTDLLDKECEQGGIYNRTFYGLRIQHVSKLQLRALHSHYTAVKHRDDVSASSDFKLMGSRLTNTINKYLPFQSELNRGIVASESGNCSMWTSSGLVAAGLMHRKRIFPKSIFVELYERNMRINPDNVKIVKYEEIKHCVKYWKGYKTVRSFVNPLLPIRNFRFWNLDNMCDVIVRVPNDQKYALVVKQKSIKPSYSFILRNLNNISVTGGAIFLLFLHPSANNSWLYNALVDNKILISVLWVVIHYWIY